jgi:hypothetical protein
MNKEFVVTFRFTDGKYTTIVGDGIKDILELARELFDNKKTRTILDIDVQVRPMQKRTGDA